MKRTVKAAVLVCLMGVVGGLVGCAGGPGSVGAASDQAKADMLGTVSKLAGTWEMEDDKGNWVPYGTFTAGSGGTAVREVMFPGQPHEMTNMYTMEGGSLLMTHYCAMGNQPHVKCTKAVKHSDGSVALMFNECAGVGDLNAADETYMGHMTLTIIDNNNATEEWNQLRAGKPTGEHHMVMKLRRKG